MTRRVVAAGVLGGLMTAAALTTNCGRPEEAVSKSPVEVAPTPTSANATPPPVVLPDVSRLDDVSGNQVRERYAALERLRQTGNTGTHRAELAKAYGDLGVILMATRHYDAAAASYLNAQALAPEEMRWPYYLGRLHLLTEERSKAVEFLKRARTLQPRDVATLVWLGRARLDDGEPNAAEALFSDAVSIDPRSAAALAGAGRAALAKRDHVRAADYLDRALASDPQASSLHYPLAMAYRALGNDDRAEMHLKQVGNGEPTLDDPLMQDYENVLQTATAFERRGTQALNEGRWAAAADTFRKGLEVEPGNAALRHRLATALVMMGDRAGAVRELEENLRRSPEHARSHFALASLLLLASRHKEASEHFAAAVKYEPGFVEARIGLAETLRLTGRIAESLPHYDQAVAADPRFVQAWVGGADALIRLGRHQEAREWLTRARVAHPNEPQLLQRLSSLP